MTGNIEQARELRKAALAAADSNPALAQSLHRKSQAVFEDEEDYDDGKTLIAGVLYDNETGEEADPQ